MYWNGGKDNVFGEYAWKNRSQKDGDTGQTALNKVSVKKRDEQNPYY